MTATFDKTNLPSRTLPYQVKQFGMRPFLVPQIMQLSRAVALKTVAPMIEALDSVLDFDAHQLTDGDFYYLLSWQRLEAYKHSPLLAQWTCSSLVFQEQDGLKRVFTRDKLVQMVDEFDSASEEERENLEDPEKLILTSRQCGHKNSLPISMRDLDIVYLSDNDCLPERLDYPRVSTLADALARKDNPDTRMIVQAARWVREGRTLDEKMEVLTAQPDLSLLEQALRMSALSNHGVLRILTKHCEACGEKSVHGYDVTPELFFDV